MGFGSAASTSLLDQARAVPARSVGWDLEPLYCFDLSPYSAKNLV